MLYLKPSEIFYSQESIKNIFTGRHIHRLKQIGDTLDELADGRTTVKQISIISVKDINGKWITADNRRLWVFKHLELLGGCTCIPAIQTNRINPRKLNSPNGGIRIRVKGHPGGKWYDKLITNPAQYQNCLRGLFSDPYSKTDFSISNPPSYRQTDNNEEFVSTRQDIDTTPPFGCQPKSVFGYHEQSDSSFYTVGSPLPGTRTISFEGTKVKRASRQAFAQLINVKQPKVNPKLPVMMMLDPSEIRYTEDTIDYPFSDKRWPTVQRRLLDLHDAENHKPLEAYMAYDIYWVKEENDILWFLKHHPDWKKIRHKLKVLVIEDNDAFLEFMRKEKPWLQISDILQIGQKI